MKARITALGTAVPDRIVDNQFFTSFLDTTDEWIRSRSGITTRRFAADDEFTSDICFRAAQNLTDLSGKDLSDVDFVIVATISPDQTMPTVAAILQDRLGLKNAGAIDISAACAGFFVWNHAGQRPDRRRYAPENTRFWQRNFVENHGFHRSELLCFVRRRRGRRAGRGR